VINWKERLRASGVHFCVSLAIAGLAAVVVLGCGPTRFLVSANFLLVVTISVILSSLFTLAIFNSNKFSAALRPDLSVLALVQLAALGHGLWMLAIARVLHPVPADVVAFIPLDPF
jgi:hypothetical protein